MTADAAVRRRRRNVILLVVALSYPIACVTGACGAYRRPPKPPPEERSLLETPPLPYVVSVVPWKDERTGRRVGGADAYARTLADLLSLSGAFRKVRIEGQPGPDADLIATSTGAYCNTAIIPVLTLISLGVIPTIFEDEDCQGMTLRSARRTASGDLKVEVRQKGTVVMGWAGVPLGLLPGWAHGDSRKDRRYGEKLRVEILRRRFPIEELAGRK